MESFRVTGYIGLDAMPRFNYVKLLQGSIDWFSPQSKAWMWDGSRKDLAECLSGNNANAVGIIIGRIRKLAAWAARTACVQIGRGDPSGWSEMLRYLAYEVQNLQLACDLRQVLKGRGSTNADSTNTPFHLLAMAIAMRQVEQTRWLGETITKARSSLLLGYDWGEKRDDPFRNYVCELYARGTGGEGLSDVFGPYAGIFDRWKDPSRLSEAIWAACDYHVEQIKVKDPDEIGVFESNPHDIFPSEILALYRVREKLGLETPIVSHPLLETPFAKVPETITYEPDPLIEQTIELAMRLLPKASAKR